MERTAPAAGEPTAVTFNGIAAIVLIFLALTLGSLYTVPDAVVGAGDGVGTPDLLRFAVIGDYGWEGSNQAAVAALVRSWNPDLVITVGDNNYDVGSASTIDPNIGQYWSSFITPYLGVYTPAAGPNRFFPSLGNHDWETPGATPYLNYFALPGNERYYTFTAGPVGFYALDSDPREPSGVVSTSIQATWFRDAISTSTACWNIPYFHHPPYSSGQHGSSLYMRWPFQTWGADVVFAGHEHNYERLNVNGLPHFIVGTGGRSLRTIPSQLPESQFRYSALYGAMIVTATRTTLDYAFIATNGAVIDTYHQDGGCGPASTPTSTGTPTRTSIPASTSTLTATHSPGPSSTSVGATVTPSVTLPSPTRTSTATSTRSPAPRNQLWYYPVIQRG